MRFTPAFILAVISALPAVLVRAQSETSSSAVPTSTAGLDSCILTCVSQAASSAGCSSFADLSCVCTSSSFQSTALSCLQSNCSSDNLSTAQGLQQTECAAFTGGSSGVSSLSSVATSALSSIGSAASSLGSSISSRITSATGSHSASITGSATVTAAATSGSSSASASNAALGLKAVFAPGVALSVAVSVIGLGVGALFI